jgi:hypothetical protein
VVWWNCVETVGQTPEVKGSIELAYNLEVNAWNDEYRMQLSALDMRCEYHRDTETQRG